MHRIGYKKDRKDKHKLIINKIEAKVVRRIYDEYSRGKKITEIKKELQEKGIPSPNNNANNGEIRYQWREETIRRILNNKIYLGHIEYGKRVNLSYKSKKIKYIPKEEWKIVYNTHEAIITEEQFNKVQRLINVNKTIKRRKHEWELNGIVKCKECGAKMTLKVEYRKDNPEEIKSKKIYCLNGLKKYKGKECIKGSKGLDKEILNKIILKNVKEILGNLLDRNKIKALIIEKNNKLSTENNAKNQELLKQELAKVESERKILYSDYKEKLLDEDDYKKYYKEKLNEKNRIKNELEILEKEQMNRPIMEESEVNQFVKDILKMKELNRNMISEMIYDIQIDANNQIYINYRCDIFKVVC